METVFRKYFWAVNLLFIALVALIAARTVNLFVEGAISPATTPVNTRTVRRAPTEIPAGLNLDRIAKLTGLPLPKVETPEAATAQRYDPNAEPVKTSLRVKLLGTLLSSDPRWSLASIQDMGNQDTVTYMVGDQVQGAQVLEIDRERVIIMNGGRKEFIDAEGGTGAGNAFAPPMRTSVAVQEPGQGGEMGQGIQAVDDNHYQVPRDTINNALSNLNSLAMQARIVPAFKDGQSEGFKLFSIRPDSLYSKIGIVNGDVIRRINGYDLNSPEKALEVYSKLKDANRIDIELDRNGSIIQKTYNIQ